MQGCTKQAARAVCNGAFSMNGWRVSLPFLLLAGLIIVRPSDSRKRERIISISLSARRLSSIWAFKAWRSDHAAEGTINRLIES